MSISLRTIVIMIFAIIFQPEAVESYGSDDTYTCQSPEPISVPLHQNTKRRGTREQTGASD